MRAARRERRVGGAATTDMEGILVVNKPAGPTSHDVVAIVRRLTGVRRVGHGGTLDPFASGVLPIFIGRATRVAEYHMGDEKAYRALVAFGARSTTDDLDGELTPTGGLPPTQESVTAALERFRGPISQVPPAFSAVHLSGRRAYELARSGERPELSPREVEILELRLADWDETAADRPTVALEVRCSAGTYIRALARDLGEDLGCGAYLAALTRTASGPFRVSEAHELDTVRAALTDGSAAGILLPVDAGLDAYPPVSPTDEELAALALGQVVRPRGGVGARPGPRDLVRVLDRRGQLAAMARVEGGRLFPEKVLIPTAP